MLQAHRQITTREGGLKPLPSRLSGNFQHYSWMKGNTVPMILRTWELNLCLGSNKLYGKDCVSVIIIYNLDNMHFYSIDYFIKKIGENIFVIFDWSENKLIVRMLFVIMKFNKCFLSIYPCHCHCKRITTTRLPVGSVF